MSESTYESDRHERSTSDEWEGEGRMRSKCPPPPHDGGRRRGWSHEIRKNKRQQTVQNRKKYRATRKRHGRPAQETHIETENNKSVQLASLSIRFRKMPRHQDAHLRSCTLNGSRRRRGHDRNRTRHDNRTPERLRQTRQVRRGRARTSVSAHVRREPRLLGHHLNALQTRGSLGADRLVRVLLGLPFDSRAPRRGCLPDGCVFLGAREQVRRVRVAWRVRRETLWRGRPRSLRARHAGSGRGERGCSRSGGHGRSGRRQRGIGRRSKRTRTKVCGVVKSDFAVATHPVPAFPL